MLQRPSPMKTISRPALALRQALHLLLASVLLMGLWATQAAHALQKGELIEMPLIKKFKEEKAAAAAAAAEAAANPAHRHAAPTSTEQPPLQHSGAKAPAAAAVAAVAAEPAVATSGPGASTAVRQLRQALTAIGTPSKQPPEKRTPPARARAEVRHQEQGPQARGAATNWAYDGEAGPQAWGKLKPEFSLCGLGKRQSPIAIQSDSALQGPAEAVQFHYTPSLGTVINNGHTIQVDLEGDNHITLRNSTYKLQQFHFHTPSEEVVNGRRYAMVAHLEHRNDAGQWAMVSVLMEQGEPNSLIEKVWTYMPLDTNDRVRMPDGLVDMNELLPADQRYYQFFGSLTTPPCTEGVLWLVIKQPLRISPEQFRLFTQLFASNARPVQAVNGRVVREAR